MGRSFEAHSFHLTEMKRMAGTTRLELATSAVTESLANVTYWKLTVLTARCKSTKGIQGNSLAGLLDPDRTPIGRWQEAEAFRGSHACPLEPVLRIEYVPNFARENSIAA